MAGLTELIESSVRASLAAESVFEAHKEGEAPAGDSVVNLAFWACAAALLCAGLAYARLESPPEPPALALGAAALAAVLALGGLAAAGALHALISLVGSEAPFGRSLLLVSLLSPILLPHVGTFWAPFPYLWAGTTLYAVWLFTRGLVRMHAVQESGALMVVGVLGLALAGAQAGLVKEGARLKAALLPPSAEEAARPAAPVSLAAPKTAPRSGGQGVPTEPAPEGVAASPDSVGMVQGVDLQAAQQLPGQQEAFALDAGGDPSKTMGSLDKWSQKLDQNSDLARSMPPEQREQLQKVKAAVDAVRLEAQQSGRPVDKNEVLLKVIMQLGAGQKPAAAEPAENPKPKKKARPKRRASEEPDLDTQLGVE